MYFGKNILKTIMLKKQKYIFWKEHIQNNSQKIEIYILGRTYAKQ